MREWGVEEYAPSQDALMAITFAVSKKNWTGNSELLGSLLNSETVWLEMTELPTSVSFLIAIIMHLKCMILCTYNDTQMMVILPQDCKISR